MLTKTSICGLTSYKVLLVHSTLIINFFMNLFLLFVHYFQYNMW